MNLDLYNQLDVILTKDAIKDFKFFITRHNISCHKNYLLDDNILTIAIKKNASNIIDYILEHHLADKYLLTNQAHILAEQCQQSHLVQKLHKAEVLANLTSHIQKDNLNDFIELIQKENISINYDDSNQETLLMNAVRFQSYKIIDYLLNRQADVNLKNKYGYGALHLSVLIQDEKIAQKLLMHGADVNATAQNGKTALFMLIENDMPKSQSFISLLLKYKASPYIKNNDGISALDLAKKNKNHSAIYLFKKSKHNPLFNLMVFGFLAFAKLKDKTMKQSKILLSIKRHFSKLQDDDFVKAYQQTHQEIYHFTQPICQTNKLHSHQIRQTQSLTNQQANHTNVTKIAHHQTSVSKPNEKQKTLGD